MYLPRFVVEELKDYLRCGRLEHGFVRVKCNGCRPEEVLGLSLTAVHQDRLVLPDSKTGPRTVMLGAAASRPLAKRLVHLATAYVLPHRGDASRPPVDVSSMW